MHPAGRTPPTATRNIWQTSRSLGDQVKQDLKGFLTPEQVVQFFRFLYNRFAYEVETYPELQTQAFRFSRNNGPNSKGRTDKILAPLLSGSFCASPTSSNVIAISLLIMEPRPDRKLVAVGEFSTTKACTIYKGFIAEDGQFKYLNKKRSTITIIKNYADEPLRIAAFERGLVIHNALKGVPEIVTKITSIPECLRLMNKIEYVNGLIPTTCRELCFSGQIPLVHPLGTRKQQISFLNLMQLMMQVTDALSNLHDKGYVHLNILDGQIAICQQSDGWNVSIDSFERMGIVGQICPTPSKSIFHDAGFRNYGVVTPFSDVFSLGILLLRTITLISEDEMDDFISVPGNIQSDRLNTLVFEYAVKEGIDRGLDFPTLTSLEELIVKMSILCKKSKLKKPADNEYLNILHVISVLKSQVVYIFECDQVLDQRLSSREDLRMLLQSKDIPTKFGGLNALYQGMPRASDILNQFKASKTFHDNYIAP